MKTRIIRVDPKRPESTKIADAAEVIKKGGLVAFPTETVYGLGANGLDDNAVRKIFAAKRRPSDNPLILHVWRIEQVKPLAAEIPKKAEKLMQRFWPGPLTIVLKKSEIVPDAVTAGLDSVAVRMPKNRIARDLIKAADCPIAAPSANLSGRPSPTSARHVIDDLAGSIDAVIDGGDVDIGLESTVIDMTQDIPKILRPGKITQNQLKSVAGKVFKGGRIDHEKPRSPGMKYRHYSPKARIVPVKDEEEQKAVEKRYPEQKIKVLRYLDETEMGKNMFKDFREADNDGYEIIVVQEVEDVEFGSAIMDRLRKASRG
jgi:L-threonylcarbamoyladenylate synthase